MVPKGHREWVVATKIEVEDCSLTVDRVFGRWQRLQMKPKKEEKRKRD
jgi:hypothetical protein